MKNLVVTILFLTLSSASSAAVLWDESVDGDLSGTGQSVGSLQLGKNTFRGTVGLFRSNGYAANADTDSAFVGLANDLHITSMDAGITATYGYGVVSYTSVAGLFSPTASLVYLEQPLNTVLENLLPIGETGTYRLFIGIPSAGVEEDAEFYWDWEINIDVSSSALSPVPEPTTLALLGLGLAGLGWRRWTRAQLTI